MTLNDSDTPLTTNEAIHAAIARGYCKPSARPLGFCILWDMRLLIGVLCLGLVVTPGIEAQTKKTPPKKTTAAPKKAAPLPPPTRVQAEWQCPAELGVGVTTSRRFCDVLTGRDPKDGIHVTIPAHRGPVTLSFELHNRHMFSAELVKNKTAYRKYTATVGVLTLDNTLMDRAVIQSEFRAEPDLFDRISGGASPGGVKAVAPTGDEFISVILPETVGEQVSILGEKLTVIRPDGTDNFSASGRPIATISNVMIEYRPAPPAPLPRKSPTKPPAKTPTKTPPKTP